MLLIAYVTSDTLSFLELWLLYLPPGLNMNNHYFDHKLALKALVWIPESKLV
jgi:hypothetical protein